MAAAQFGDRRCGATSHAAWSANFACVSSFSWPCTGRVVPLARSRLLCDSINTAQTTQQRGRRRSLRPIGAEQGRRQRMVESDGLLGGRANSPLCCTRVNSLLGLSCCELRSGGRLSEAESAGKACFLSSSTGAQSAVDWIDHEYRAIPNRNMLCFMRSSRNEILGTATVVGDYSHWSWTPTACTSKSSDADQISFGLDARAPRKSLPHAGDQGQ